MVTFEQMKKWLTKKGFQSESDHLFSQDNIYYELHSDYFRLLRKDAKKQLRVIEITSFVDMFLDEDGEIKIKWQFVLHKNMAPQYFNDNFDSIPWKPK